MEMINKKFKICVCFTKSRDEHHVGRLHLIASIILIDEDNENFYNILYNIRNRREGCSGYTTIVEVFYNDGDLNYFNCNDVLLTSNSLVWMKPGDYVAGNYFEDINSNSNLSGLIRHSLSGDLRFRYLQVYFNNLVNIFDSSNDQSLIKNLFSFEEDLNERKKEYNDILYIFNNITWSNILLKFKINGIDISGGSSTTRHILTTSDIFLNIFLCDMFNGDVKSIAKVGYVSYKSNKMLVSNRIPLYLYESYMSFCNTGISLKYNEFKKVNMSDEDGRTKLNILDDNYEISKVLLKDYIFNNKSKILGIEKLEKEISDTQSKSDKNKEIYLRITGSNVSRHTSNKEKKRIKKENTEFLKNNKHIDVDQVEKDRIYYDELLNRLEYNLRVAKKTLTKYMYEFSTYRELVKEFEKNNDFEILYNEKKKDIQKIKKNNTPLGVRKFSSISHFMNYKGVYLEDNKFLKIKKNKEFLITGNLSNKRVYSVKAGSNSILFANDHPIYLELNFILNTYPFNNQTEIKIEEILLSQGSIFLQNRLGNNMNLNSSKLQTNNFKVLTDVVDDLHLLINNYKKNIFGEVKKNDEDLEMLVHILSVIDNDIIISYLLGRVLNIISNRGMVNNYTYTNKVSIDLSKDLIQYYFSQQFNDVKKDYNNSLSFFIKKKYNDNRIYKKDSFLLILGITLFNFLMELNIIEMKIYQVEKGMKYTIYVPTQKFMEKILLSEWFLDMPLKLPMIVKPNLYGIVKSVNDAENYVKLGGYLLNDKKYVVPLIIKNPEWKVFSEIEDNNIVYNMVNNISSVGFKINNDVLDFIMEYGIKYNLIINFSNADSLQFFDFKELNNSKKNFFKDKLTIKNKKKVLSFRSKKFLEMNILGLANLFKDVPEFYIPVRIDNRGRVYCVPDYLNYQSIELAKSLLLFSKGEKVKINDMNAINFLKIYGANCYGNGIDKNSFDYRINWVNENQNDILEFKNGKLLSKAEKKFLFIAFCFEYKNYFKSISDNSDYFITYLPIQLDATCNGLQHLSLLIGDKSLGNELNFIESSFKDKPKDLYSFFNFKIQEYFKEKIKNIEDKKEEDKDNNIITYKKFLKVKTTRQSVKSSIMVKPYNASLVQMNNYFKDTLEEVINDSNSVVYVFRENKDVIFTHKELMLFSKILDMLIYVEFPKLKVINDYLKKIAEICSSLDIPIVWALPSGLVVNQYYEDSEIIRLKPFKFKKNTFKLLRGNNKLHKAKQVRALMPNLIHSLDATSLALLVDYYFNNNISSIKNFYAVHDCFAVTANNVTQLMMWLKFVYLEIYSKNQYLKTFDEGIINNIKLHFGEKAFDSFTKQIKVNNKIIDYPDVNLIIAGKVVDSNITNATYLIN